MSYFNACATVLRCSEKFVLVRETRSAKAGLYNLPAGTLEVHEDVFSCARREAREETGADVRLEHFMGLYEMVVSRASNILLLVFSGSVDPSAPLGSDEHREVRAFSYDEILALNTSGKLRSPVVMRAITDFRQGRQLPLSAIRTWKVQELDAVTVSPATAAVGQ